MKIYKIKWDVWKVSKFKKTLAEEKNNGSLRTMGKAYFV